MPPPAATSSLTLPPLFHARKLRQTLRKITGLINAISNKTAPDRCANHAAGIVKPVHLLAESGGGRGNRRRSQHHNRRVAKREPGSDGKGRRPCCIILRVTLSIAAIWSASTAWRNPYPRPADSPPSARRYRQTPARPNPRRADLPQSVPAPAAARGCWRKIVTIMMISCEPADGPRPRPPDQTRLPHLRQVAAAETAE